MTIHNLKFQGTWDTKRVRDITGLPQYYFVPDKLEAYKDANYLKGGILGPESEVIQIDRDQSCLPVVTVDDIRTEINHRQSAQDSLGEEREFLDISVHRIT